MKAPRANPYNINDILTNRSLAFGFPSRSTEWYLVVPQVPRLLSFTCLPHSEPPPITFSLAPGSWLADSSSPPHSPLALLCLGFSSFSSTAFRKAGLLSHHQATTSLSCSCLSIPHSSFLSLPTSCPGYHSMSRSPFSLSHKSQPWKSPGAHSNRAPNPASPTRGTRHRDSLTFRCGSCRTQGAEPSPLCPSLSPPHTEQWFLEQEVIHTQGWAYPPHLRQRPGPEKRNLP